MMIVRRECKECGSEFAYEQTWKGRPREVCSDDCKDAIYRRLLGRLKEDRDKKRREEAFKRFDKKAEKIKRMADAVRRECTYCGVTFTPVGYNGKGHFVRHPKTLMCGKGCSTKAAADAAAHRWTLITKGVVQPSEAEAPRLDAAKVRRDIDEQVRALKNIRANVRRWVAKITERHSRRCIHCDAEFAQSRPFQRSCSDACTNKARKASRQLARRAHRKRYGNKWRHKARQYGVEYEPVNVYAVFERDGWRCQICSKPTPRERRGTRYSNAPELDHRVPISNGGSHTTANVQCACRACNGSKGNRSSVGQMPLISMDYPRPLSR